MILLRSPLACLLSSYAIVAGALSAAASLPPTPSFYKDIAPILQTHCVQCHRPGEIAPMPLTSYEQVRPWAAAIKEAVLIEVHAAMVVRRASDSFFQRLADAEARSANRKTIRRWVESGAAPAREIRKMRPATNRVADGRENGRLEKELSVILTLPKPQQISGNGQDLWKFIVFDKTFDQDTWIRGLEIRPGNREVVHHANIWR